jgi:hypothetical protein
MAQYINARELRQGAVRRLVCLDWDFGGRLNYSLAARLARVGGGSRRVVLTCRLYCFCLHQACLAASGPVSLEQPQLLVHSV